MIELKDHESGVRKHDILSTAIDMPEHTGCVHGVSRSKGWKEAFGKENEGLWKKKKRSYVDPDRLKKEIMDEIFGKLRAAGIDVEVALGASHGKRSCAAKEVEQQLAAPAGKHSPPSPGRRSMPVPEKCLRSSHDELDTFNRLNGPTPYSLITRDFSTLLMS